MNRKRIICLDFETSGLNFLQDQPIEYSAISVETDGTFKRLHNYVKFDGKLSPQVIELTGITDEQLNSEGLDYDMALTELIEFIGINTETILSDVIIVGHNFINFDLHFLEMACARLGYDTIDPNCIWDTAGCYKTHKLGLVREQNETVSQFFKRGLSTYAKGVYFKLAVVCESLNIPLSNAHSAIADTEATLEIFKHQARQHNDYFMEYLI
jgi:DNA polymerase-3 subunit alpha (Gram-positive type)